MSVFETLLSGLDVTTIIIFLLVFLVAYYWLSTPSNLPPGPPGLPVLGNMLSLAHAGSDLIGLMKRWRQQYGDVFTVRLGSKYMIVISSYEITRNTYVKNGDVFSHRPSILYSATKLIEAIGLGIVLSNGQEWKDLRRMTLTTFRDFGVGKKSLEDRVHEEARALVEVLDKGQGQTLAVRPLLAKFSSNLICSIVLGNRFEYEDAQFLELINMISKSLEEPILFTPANFVSFMRFLPSGEKEVTRVNSNFRKLNDILETVLKEHEETYDPSEVRDFVDLCIKTRSETDDSRLYSKANMRAVILDLLTAGTDTTASTVEWSLLYLITYPVVQKRCQQDIDKVVGDGRMVTMEDRKNLPYVMAVITEINRIATIAPLGVPHMSQREGEIGGYTVPAESLIMINVAEIHKEPTAWEEPDVFKPERFLDKDGQFCPPRDNYMPFSIGYTCYHLSVSGGGEESRPALGYGPRVCLGESLARMELFILLTTLLQRFTFTMAQGQKPDLEGHLGTTYSAKSQPVLATRR